MSDLTDRLRRWATASDESLFGSAVFVRRTCSTAAARIEELEAREAALPPEHRAMLDALTVELPDGWRVTADWATHSLILHGQRPECRGTVWWLSDKWCWFSRAKGFPSAQAAVDAITGREADR